MVLVSNCWRLARFAPLTLLLVVLAGCAAEATPLPPDATQTARSTVAAIPTPLAMPASTSTPTLTREILLTPEPPAVENEPVSPPEAAVMADVKKENAATPPAIEKPRSVYDATKPFSELVRPHFYAATAEGELTEVRGEPDLVVEVDGKVKVHLLDDSGTHSFLDPLALESELVGEHPVHKIYRLMEMGVPVDDDLLTTLESGEGGGLFTTVEFEYQRRRFSTGVIAEIFVDGTFLVIPDEVPPEWQSNDDRIASPTHLHLNARSLSGGSTDLAREYELEILSLPFEDQRYPPAPLALKQCRVYEESLAASDYLGVLESVGFRYTPEHITRAAADSAGLPDRTQALLYNGSGAGVQYFGFEGWWIAAILKGEQVPWLGDCDTAGGFRAYPGGEDSESRHYLIVRRSLEPDRKQRYKVLEVNGAGEATELYTAPGIILMALPLPYDARSWLFSTEGWTPAEADRPADPRWQAVYMVNLDRPDEYAKVRYPIDEFPRAPDAGLYGASARMSDEGHHLFNTLYGFKDEGGGIWVVDVRDEGFLSSDSGYARLVSWDHTLSWMPLGRLEDDPTALHLFMTGKEVADDFAMTANVLRVREDGLNSTVEKSERLLQMVGWNPVPFGWQKLSETQYRMLVETHYNYESSLMPRAKGVYIIPVSLTGE